jgi:ABC-type Mn2+/Zn2+ transport system permease subunit/Mn-dependent DtxR family transcriptional regulator
MEFLYDMFVDPLRYTFMQRALLASAMVGVICGVLGCFIILRRMALIGDALAHAILPGVVIGFMVAGKGQLTLFLGAVIAGVVTALLIGFVNRHSRIKEDTAIGVVFTGAFALGILLISQLKTVHLDLQHFLFGDPLGVSQADIWLTAVIGMIVVGSIILFYKQLLLTSFDPVMAAAMGMATGVVHYFLMTILSMTVVASLQAVGIVLVVAMLITPGATAYLLTDRLPRMLMLAALVGVASAVFGLYLSYWMNYSSGAAMVLVATTMFGLAFLFAPQRGVVVRYLRLQRTARKNLEEDYIKVVHRLSEKMPAVTVSELARTLGLAARKADALARNLVQRGWLARSGENLTLTATGKREALRILRSHRLWELFLSERAGLQWDQVDEDAERFEHLLPEELVDEIDEKLGYPEADPHGAPIPRKDGAVTQMDDRPLSELPVGASGVITRVSDQLPEVLTTLWNYGLVPNVKLTVVSRTNGKIEVAVGEKRFTLTEEMTRLVRVRA